MLYILKIDIRVIMLHNFLGVEYKSYKRYLKNESAKNLFGNRCLQ